MVNMMTIQVGVKNEETNSVLFVEQFNLQNTYNDLQLDKYDLDLDNYNILDLDKANQNESWWVYAKHLIRH